MITPDVDLLAQRATRGKKMRAAPARARRRVELAACKTLARKGNKHDMQLFEYRSVR